ncbi:type II toxin-antitoxin system VapC family toxin, partial [Escherichia coli]|nr:type II toxin-antitoxin system VapC family toxin [Escherichia coli]
ERVDAILAWDKAAVDETAVIKKCLSDVGMSIGNNDSAIAGHAIAVNAILVTNNTREFSRVEGLRIEDWTKI